jgi:hypothetical protein
MAKRCSYFRSIVFIGVIAANSLLYAQATGGVQGTVRDDAGQILAGANVILTTASANVGTLTATTDGSGNFSFTGVKPGSYTICLRDAGNKHLDPCAWSTGARVVVKPNQTATDNIVTGTAAATLQVRVDDPLKLLDPLSGIGVPMVAIILSDNTLTPMNLTGADGGGRTFQLAVPPGTHRLFIRSEKYRIANGRGEDLDRPATSDGKIRVTPVDAPVSVKSGMSYVEVTITGRR